MMGVYVRNAYGVRPASTSKQMSERYFSSRVFGDFSSAAEAAMGLDGAKSSSTVTRVDVYLRKPIPLPAKAMSMSGVELAAITGCEATVIDLFCRKHRLVSVDNPNAQSELDSAGGVTAALERRPALASWLKMPVNIVLADEFFLEKAMGGGFDGAVLTAQDGYGVERSHCYAFGNAEQISFEHVHLDLPLPYEAKKTELDLAATR